MKLVKLTTCENSFSAEVLKGALEAEGIPCVLQGENMSVIYGGINLFGVGVLVKEEDLERASEIINAEE